MKRILFGLSILASFGVCSAAEPAPAKKSGAPLELVLLGEHKLARIEVLVEVDGTPISTIWSDTFAKLFAYLDRNGDGSLDAKEASVLPSARSLRQAMGNGFTPPAGLAPEHSELDLNGDGKVTADELAAHYRAAGIGNAQIGVGRLPLSAELTSALIKYLDTEADGSISEKEWKAAPDSLRKLDKNEDELIGAGELVPRIFYPSAAGTNLLAPPAQGTAPSELIAKLPLVVLPADAKNSHWAKEIARRNPHFKADDLAGWRAKEPDAKWTIRLSEKGTSEGFVFGGDRIRVEGWTANGRLSESLASARKQILAELDAPPEPKEKGTGRQRAGGLGWLLPIADRNGDGDLDSKELDAWFDLQTQIGRGQVLLTVLDNGGLFESLDANHDGALSIRELRTAWQRMKDTDTKNPARLLLVAASHGYPRTLTTSVRRGPAWFQAMDKNGDGDVSRREFTGQAEVFDKLDVDKDGLLNAEEAEKAGAIIPKSK